MKIDKDGLSELISVTYDLIGEYKDLPCDICIEYVHDIKIIYTKSENSIKFEFINEQD